MLLSRQEKKNTRVYFAHFAIEVEGNARKGHATVAIVKKDDKVIYGISYCAPSDQFCRKEGRNRAIKRLYSVNDYKISYEKFEGTAYDACEKAVMNDVSVYAPLPWYKGKKKVFISPKCRSRVKNKYPERKVEIELG